MMSVDQLGEAQATLLAAHFVVNADFDNLQALVAEREDVLPSALVHALLLTLYPADEATLPALTKFLLQLQDGFADYSSLDHHINTAPVHDLSSADAERRVRHLRLQQSHSEGDEAYGTVTSFIISLVHREESASGLSPALATLVDAFADRSAWLREWRDAYLLPVLRLQFEFYPDALDSATVRGLEIAIGESGVKMLLQHTERESGHAHVGRDLQYVVTPWIRGATSNKRRRLSSGGVDGQTRRVSWKDVNEWLLSTSLTDFNLAAKAVAQWTGPRTEEASDLAPEEEQFDPIAYAQTALAIIYGTTKPPEEVLAATQLLLGRAALLAKLRPPDFSDAMPDVASEFPTISKTSKADMVHSTLLNFDNPLTRPTEESIEFLRAAIATAELLLEYKLPLCVKDVAEVCLLGSEERHRQELRRFLQQVPKLTRSAINWPSVRQQLLWLRSWRHHTSGSESHMVSGNEHAFLSRIPIEFLENEVLNGMLAAGNYDSVVTTYITSSTQPLSMEQVEKQVVSSIYHNYDNATNGNRNRGGMKRASDMLKAFLPHFPQSATLDEIEHLIKATHSLSFYQLTLQHGVPFQPVNIRVHKDPLVLIEKILEQNQDAYTNLDNLLDIARDLVRAGLPAPDTLALESESREAKLFNAEHRVTYMGIKSSLSRNDFDTAYSYITTRLSTSGDQPSEFIDDTSWRAAYAAGRYRPSASPESLHARISSLSKRMDLLSQALTLTPNPDPLPEILGTWRRCEEELDSLKSQAVEEERAFEISGTKTLPGGFGLEDRDVDAAETRHAMARRGRMGAGPSYEEEAPVGLFDVARGAASAIRKSAFPLSAAGTGDIKIRDDVGEYDGQGGSQRVRKRDMVASAVTGGLVSGMSWVLGAQPATPRPGSAASDR